MGMKVKHALYNLSHKVLSYKKIQIHIKTPTNEQLFKKKKHQKNPSVAADSIEILIYSYASVVILFSPVFFFPVIYHKLQSLTFILR